MTYQNYKRHIKRVLIGVSIGMSIGLPLGIIYGFWHGATLPTEIIKFTIETAHLWLSFLTAILAALVVFIALIYSVHDDLFWSLLSKHINIEKRAFKAVFFLAVACVFLIVCSPPQASIQDWRSVLALLGVIIGITALLKSGSLFFIFYNLSYSSERQKRLMSKSKTTE